MTNFRKLFILSGLLSLSLIDGQNKNGNGEVVAGARPPETQSTEGKPLELRETFGKGQKPAFEGQTRIGSVKTKTPYKEEIITDKLNEPWGMAFLPDGRILITEQKGKLRIVTQDGKISKKLKGLPKNIAYGGDAGLLDVAIDPNFESNHTVYLSYVEKKKNKGTGLIISAAKLSDDESELLGLKKIYVVRDSTGEGMAHYGSRLIFDDKGKLLVSIAERMFKKKRVEAQWLSSQLGKIIRINTDGTPAEGNPKFTSDSLNVLPEIYALGVRNPQGLAWNPVTKELWEDEHGQQGGDEINIIRPGKNYGWPTIAYGVEYDWKIIGNNLTQKEGMEQPIYYWDPTVAPSGCTFYTGTSIPEWKNNMFIATLAGEHIVRLVIESDKVIGEERLLLGQKSRMRDVEMGNDGNLWVISDEKRGKLIKISKK
ncbi:hypothetical protein B0A69_02745 [Chryseobacterium shigense]|uniref:Glucose/arabinose dehydrogenase, beta-propeller fold n=1 Tax=Chryseobacterium shigense TaxID=297244 RepID=A0A1N7I8B1_9FLAO|nr:PQQ-dependent sugar dehydrogenase [Chryseobacterium shigense]PQA96984.1 hypothetical protein B0A69_02745 [Chryseobacterium shigense]SIS33314.1 Glucose/arabinose dehydrogenase, beta-propeller fold [Chryseobacterium shigense]